MSITAMKQALEVLETLQRYDGTLTGKQAVEAITALRQAIEQAGQVKPVAWRFERPGISKVDVWPHGGEWEPLYLHPPTAQVKQRPVARVNSEGFIVEINDVLIAPGQLLYLKPETQGGVS